MACDWIKMRTDLYRDPKVIMIANHLMRSTFTDEIARTLGREFHVTLNVTRNVTVGCLVSIWGVTRQQGERRGNDLFLMGVSIDVVDDICETPGFGEAMESVGWVIQEPFGLVFPGFFSEYNEEVKKTKSNAERQKDYRERKKCTTPSGGRYNSNESNAEKSREEKRNNTGRPVSVRQVSIEATWEDVRGSVQELAKSIVGERRLTPADRELAIKGVVFSGMMNGEIDELVSDIKRKVAKGGLARPWGYFKKSLIRISKEKGIDFDAQWAAIEIPAEILNPKSRVSQ